MKAILYGCPKAQDMIPIDGWPKVTLLISAHSLVEATSFLPVVKAAEIARAVAEESSKGQS